MSLMMSCVVVLTTAALGGCGLNTEYVPRTPGVAALGMERGVLGVYKNGAFTRLGDGVPALLSCSAPAAAAADTAEHQHRRFQVYNWVAFGGYLLIATPLAFVGGTAAFVGEGAGLVVLGGFGVPATNAQHASDAFTIDAINLHNDTAACLGATAPTAPAAGSQP
jgi:hypothetical protein